MDVKAFSQGRQNTENISLRQVEKTNLNNNQLTYNAASNRNNTNEKEIKGEDIKKAAEKLNKLFEDKNTHVEYEVYGKSKSITIKIVDDNTKEVIKELPPKKLIDMVDKLCELAGLFMDEKA